MKILFFIPALEGGGAERVMATLTKEFSTRGYTIYIATDISKPIAYEFHDNIHILDLFLNNHSTKKRTLKYFRLYKRIRGLTKDLKPDVVISFLWIMNSHVLLATSGLPVPVIASEHFTFDTNHSILSRIMRFHINKLATKVTILTNHDLQILGKRLPNKVLMPNPLSFPIIPSGGGKQKTVLSVGSLNRWKGKGIDNLISVWSHVHRNHPDWKLIIAGTGSRETMELLEKIVRQHGVSEGIEFIGFQKNIDQVMKSSAIFVLPSRYEAFGMVLIEAMSQGCACVSFDCVGPKELIKDGYNGVLVAEQDLKKMEEAISELIKNEEYRKIISENALHEVERFRAENIADRWDKLFQDVLAQN